MALDRLLDLSAHWFFYVLVLFLPVLVIPTCCRLSWPAVWPTFGAHDKPYSLCARIKWPQIWVQFTESISDRSLYS